MVPRQPARVHERACDCPRVHELFSRDGLRLTVIETDNFSSRYAARQNEKENGGQVNPHSLLEIPTECIAYSRSPSLQILR